MALELPKEFNTQQYNDRIVEWAKKGRNNLMAEISKLPLRDKARLFKSIKIRNKKTAGEIDRIRYDHLYYGFFWDHGAKNLFGNPDLEIAAYNWIAQAINPIIDELGDSVAEFYGDQILINTRF